MSLRLIVAKALSQNANIVTTAEELDKHKGFPTAYLATIGLTKAVLHKLETMGLAKRAYTKNVWTEGDMLPNLKKVEKGQRFVGSGSRCVWMLICDPQVEAAHVNPQ